MLTYLQGLRSAPLLLGVLGFQSACSDPASVSWAEEDLGETGSLSGVWGTGPNDVFVVGGNDEAGEVHHFDGSTWSKMNTPAGTSLLVWSYGFSPSDVWSVGRGGTVVHYDGSSWNTVESGTDQDLWGVWGAGPNDVYVVGGDVTDNGEVTILHWDGNQFNEEELPGSENPLQVRALFKVFGIDGRVFAVGQDGLIVERTASGWVRRPAGEGADQDFVSLWGTSANNIVAVGGRASARIAVFDGETWKTIAPSENRGGLNAVYIDEKGQVLVGGLSGSIGVFNRETEDVEYETSAITIDVHAIWSDLEGSSYAVGGTFFSPHVGAAMTRKER